MDRRVMLTCLLCCILGSLPQSYADPLPVYHQENVQFHQFCLTVLGFDPGPIDGQMGPKTQLAWVQALQVYGRLNGFEAAARPDLAMVAVFQDCGYKMMLTIVQQESALTAGPPPTTRGVPNTPQKDRMIR